MLLLLSIISFHFFYEYNYVERRVFIVFIFLHVMPSAVHVQTQKNVMNHGAGRKKLSKNSLSVLGNSVRIIV